MTAFREQKLLEIFSILQNKEEDTRMFSMDRVFAHTTPNLPFVHDQLSNTHYVQPSPFPSEIPEKYHFVGSKQLYERNLAFYDQINYLEARFKGDYLPRETLVGVIEDDWNTPAVLKKKGNTLVSKCLPNNTVALIFPYFPYNLGVLTYQYSPNPKGQDDYLELGLNPVLSIQQYDLSKRVSPTQILQIEKGFSNEIFVRSLYRCYKLKLDLEAAENSDSTDNGPVTYDSQFQFISEMGFPSEVLECKASPYHSEKTFFLCNYDLLYMMDDEKHKKIPIKFPTNNNHNTHCNLMDISFHPSVLFLSNSHQVFTLDVREGSTNLAITSSSTEGAKSTYALKHLYEQYFATINDKFLSIYDIRYPTKSVFDFDHFCDENPLDILDFSQVYDPIEANGINSVEDLLSLVNGMDTQDGSTGDLSGNRLVYGYSTSNGGQSVLLPNKVFEKFKDFKDKYSDISEKDEYMTALMMTRKTSESNLSHLFFEQFNHMKMLFSTSLQSEAHKIRGMNMINIGKDLIVSQCDNKSNVSFHLVREQEGKYISHRISQLRNTENVENDAEMGKQEVNEWTQLNQKIKDKFYQDIKNSDLLLYTGKEYSQRIRLNEEENGFDLELEDDDDNDEEELKQGTDKKNINQEEEDFDCYNFRPLVEIITKEDDSYKRAYRRFRKKASPAGGLGLLADKKADDDDSQGEMEAEDEIKMHKEEQQQSAIWTFLERTRKEVTEVPKDLKAFVVTKSLVDYLDQSW